MQLRREGLPVEPCNVADYERIAQETLEPGAYGYFAGGAGDEHTLHENAAAYRRWQLRPRALVDVSEATTVTKVLGKEVSMPLLVAPVAFQRMAHPDGEPGMARAAAAAGTVMVLSTLATSTSAEIAAAAPGAPSLVPALHLPRPRIDAGADRPGRGGRLRGDRADRRRAAARPPRA